MLSDRDKAIRKEINIIAALYNLGVASNLTTIVSDSNETADQFYTVTSFMASGIRYTHYFNNSKH